MPLSVSLIRIAPPSFSLFSAIGPASGSFQFTFDSPKPGQAQRINTVFSNWVGTSAFPAGRSMFVWESLLLGQQTLFQADKQTINVPGGGNWQGGVGSLLPNPITIGTGEQLVYQFQFAFDGGAVPVVQIVNPWTVTAQYEIAGVKP